MVSNVSRVSRSDLLRIVQNWTTSSDIWLHTTPTGGLSARTPLTWTCVWDRASAKAASGTVQEFGVQWKQNYSTILVHKACEQDLLASRHLLSRSLPARSTK